MKNINYSLQIACDGGAATGKSTGAKMIAKKYKLRFLSSGLLYRYASFLILKNKPKNKLLFLKKKFKTLNYKNLEKINLHLPAISDHSSIIAKNKNVRNENFLTPFQIKQMSFQPDFILEYAHYLGEHFEEKGMKNIQVFTDSFVALNGRSSQRFINPNVDLLTKKESFLNKDWVLPLNDEIKGL